MALKNAIPTLEFKCLPKLSQKKLLKIHESVVKVMASFPETEIKDENGQLNLFQADLMKYGLGKEIKIEISDLPQSCKNILKTIIASVGDAVSIMFPDANIYCKAECCNPKAAYWSSKVRKE